MCSSLLYCIDLLTRILKSIYFLFLDFIQFTMNLHKIIAKTLSVLPYEP